MHVYRKGYYCSPLVVAKEITITEVTETRVKGILMWPETHVGINFDVKRHPGNKFEQGSGSGKRRYGFTQE